LCYSLNPVAGVAWMALVSALPFSLTGANAMKTPILSTAIAVVVGSVVLAALVTQFQPKEGSDSKSTAVSAAPPELVSFLHDRHWHVERMSADAFQNGIPDLFCYHKKWGIRWVEIKRPVNYAFCATATTAIPCV